jgi:hypothetical protein
MCYRMMIIRYDNGLEQVYHCPTATPIVQDFSSILPDEPIPIFYSHRHATDSGWHATKDIRFCPPNSNYVYVCPFCWESSDKKIQAKSNELIIQTGHNQMETRIVPCLCHDHKKE